jgi:hypothetical protein
MRALARGRRKLRPRKRTKPNLQPKTNKAPRARKASEEHYGEIAVHFKSGNKPLVLSISEVARNHAYSQLQGNGQFITFVDLADRSFAIRQTAISELYFSSEAHDWYGPAEEHDGYEITTQKPDDEVVTIQLSSGKLREVRDHDCNLYDCWGKFEFPNFQSDGNMILLPFLAGHHELFLNRDDLDYISFPTHRVEAGRVADMR